MNAQEFLEKVARYRTNEEVEEAGGLDPAADSDTLDALIKEARSLLEPDDESGEYRGPGCDATCGC